MTLLPYFQSINKVIRSNNLVAFTSTKVKLKKNKVASLILTGGFVISHQSFGMSVEISEKIKSVKKTSQEVVYLWAGFY